MVYGIFFLDGHAVRIMYMYTYIKADSVSIYL